MAMEGPACFGEREPPRRAVDETHAELFFQCGDAAAIGRPAHHGLVGEAAAVDKEELSARVVEAGEDKVKRLVGVELHLGDGCGPRTYAGTGDGRCGQGSFLSVRRTPGALPGADSQDMCDPLIESTGFRLGVDQNRLGEALAQVQGAGTMSAVCPASTSLL